jgi:hypothetical protein
MPIELKNFRKKFDFSIFNKKIIKAIFPESNK